MFLISKIQENCFSLYSPKQFFENRKQKLLKLFIKKKTMIIVNINLTRHKEFEF